MVALSGRCSRKCVAGIGIISIIAAFNAQLRKYVVVGTTPRTDEASLSFHDEASSRATLSSAPPTTTTTTTTTTTSTSTSATPSPWICNCAADPDSLIEVSPGVRDPAAKWKAEAKLIDLEHALDARHLSIDNATAMDLLYKEIGDHVQRCMFCGVRESEVTDIGTLFGKQLFADDFLVQSATGVQRFMSAPSSTQLVMTFSETAGFFGSINYNGSVFIMHYRRKKGHTAMHVPHDKQRAQLGVTFSHDGIHWSSTKVHGLNDVNGGGEQCVLLDEEEEQADYRFKMTYNCLYPHRDQLCIATSPDGVVWKNWGVKSSLFMMDTQACLYYDSKLQAYELFARKEFPTKEYRRAIRGIIVARVGREAFLQALPSHGTDIPFSVVSDWYLGRFGYLEMYRRQVYAVTRTKYEGLYFGVLHIYDWPLPNSGCPRALTDSETCNDHLEEFVKRHVAVPDSVRPYLATSRDGLHFNFQWVYAETPWHLGQHRKDGFVIPASQLITANGYHYMYFSRNPSRHRMRWSRPEEVHVAQFKQDRLIGLERKPSASAGVVLTREFSLPAQARSLAFLVNIPRGSAFDAHMRCFGGSSPESQWISLGSWMYTDHEERKLKAYLPMSMVKEPGKRLQMQFTLHGLTKLFAFSIQ